MQGIAAVEISRDTGPTFRSLPAAAFIVNALISCSPRFGNMWNVDGAVGARPRCWSDPPSFEALVGRRMDPPRAAALSEPRVLKHGGGVEGGPASPWRQRGLGLYGPRPQVGGLRAANGALAKCSLKWEKVSGGGPSAIVCQPPVNPGAGSHFQLPA